MKVAHIVPVDFPIISTGYHMILAHLLKNPIYKLKYKNARGYKILDNSIIELGNAIKIQDILKLADGIEFDELILPDALNDGKKTVELAKEAIHFLNTTGYTFKLMAVPQGKTIEEWIKCYKELLQLPIDTIGINKLTHNLLGSRESWCDYLYQNNYIDTKYDYHLLGLPSNIIEIKHQTKHKWIRGLDTCAAYLLARDSITIDSFGLGANRPDKTINFHDKLNVVTWKNLKAITAKISGWLY